VIWAGEMVRAAREDLSVPAAQITWLAENPQRDPERIAAVSRRDDVVRAIEGLGRTSAPGDRVLVLLVGHGTARDGKALFNLPGPDLSATELHQELQQLAGRPLVVINTTSASGAFVRELSAPGRVVITATASGSEYQFAHFGGQFVGAFVARTADSNKDGRVSMLEAFEHARKSVARRFAACHLRTSRTTGTVSRCCPRNHCCPRSRTAGMATSCRTTRSRPWSLSCTRPRPAAELVPELRRV